MALIWSAGIIWLAVSVGGPDDDGANATQPTDVTGATISDENLKQFADFAERK